ncbi:hypothetical protein [Veillonella magna]|uniref:hypothetical protein n=1 Tax=Veillonella magna TaxID=464322 RepID=UPI0026666E70|nr:hypothetical protein [Veillonella magna]
MKRYLKYSLIGLGGLLWFGSVGHMDVNPDADMTLQLLIIAIGAICVLVGERIDTSCSGTLMQRVEHKDGQYKVTYTVRREKI